MMTVDVLASRDVPTTLNFYTALDDESPYNYYKPPTGVQKTNVGKDNHTVVVHDARPELNAFTLDVTGFQFVHHPSVEKDFFDEDKIKTVYYAEVEEILKTYAGAKRVFIFNHKIRRPSPVANEKVYNPLHQVHVDQTPVAAAGRVREFMGDDAERLLKGRYRIINVWRPIANPVAHTPLALIDYCTIDPDRDLVSTRQIDPTREGTLFNIKYDPGHKFYYLSDQTPDEVTLFKSFDSDVDRARGAPHSAFHDSTTPADAPKRQSIEVRALVFDTE